jgi:hypothetical protein
VTEVARYCEPVASEELAALGVAALAVVASSLTAYMATADAHLALSGRAANPLFLESSGNTQHTGCRLSVSRAVTCRA